MKLSYGKLFSLAVHTVLIVVATWLLVLAVFEDVTMDARLGCLAVLWLVLPICFRNVNG